MIGQRLTDADGNVYEIAGQYGGGWSVAAVDPFGPAEVVSTAELHERFKVVVNPPAASADDEWADLHRQVAAEADAPQRPHAMGEQTTVADRIIVRDPTGLAMPSPEMILRKAATIAAQRERERTEDPS